MSGHYIFILCVLTGGSILLLGILDFAFNFENNNCQMTWMYEWPMYNDVRLTTKIQQKYPTYKLIYYTEGYLSTYDSDTKLDGIPVLFIPGNAGSCKQVRSLASVALRRAEHFRSSFHFDFFSVDFNEELSGLYGGVLRRQTDFVAVCLKKILSLYKYMDHPPTSVILIGHSMGGVLARAVFTLPHFDPHMVSVIITQSTPHQMPVVSLDASLPQFYSRVNTYWNQHQQSALSHILLVTTGGGFRDLLVRQALTDVPPVLKNEHVIYTSTMSVPKSWVSTDHLCAVWCRQMVLVTVRSLFDAVDPVTNQIHADISYRRRVFSHHFVSNTGLPFSATSQKAVRLTMEDIRFSDANHLYLSFRKVNTNMAYSLDIPESADCVTAITNIVSSDWIAVCVNQTSGSAGTNCFRVNSTDAVLVPSPSNAKKVIHLDTSSIPTNHLIVFLIPESKTQVYISASVYNRTSIERTVTVPSLMGLVTSYPRGLLTRTPVLVTPPESSHIFYNVTLSGLENVLQTYTLTMMTSDCTSNRDSNDATTLVLSIPWTPERTNLTVIKSQNKADMYLRLFANRPPTETRYPQLRAYFQPGCRYTLSIQFNIKLMFGQIVRFYAVMIPAFIVANIYVCLFLLESLMFKSRDYVQLPWISFRWTLWLLPLIVTTFLVYPARMMISLPIIDKADSNLLYHQNILCPVVYPVLFLIGLTIVAVYSFLIHAVMACFSKLLSPFITRIRLPKSIPYFCNIFHVLLMMIGIIFSMNFIGIIGLLLCYGIKIIQVVSEYVTKPSDTLAKQKALFNALIWQSLCLLNFAPFVHWIRNLQYSVKLSPDPLSVVSPVMCITMAISMLLPHLSRPSWCFTIKRSLLHVLPCLIITFGGVSVYRITFLISGYVMVETLLKLIDYALSSKKIASPLHSKSQ